MPASLECLKIGRELHISAHLPLDVSSLEIRLFSDRNRSVSKFTDVSANHHLYEDADGLYSEFESDMWFPIVDVELEDDMMGIAVFEEPTTGEYSINPTYNKGRPAIKSQIEIDCRSLQNWENYLHISSRANSLKQFFLKKRFHVSGQRFEHTFHLLSDDWSGEIVVYGLRDDKMVELESIRIEDRIEASPSSYPQKPDDDNLVYSLKETIRFLLRSQNSQEGYPTKGGLYMLYDLDARSYRAAQWCWSWGPAISLLLEAARIDELADEFGRENLERVAAEIGDAALRFQILDAGHPACGLLKARWQPSLLYDDGYMSYCSAGDSCFFVKWGLIPLHQSTGDGRYLHAAESIVTNTIRWMDQFDVIPADYFDELSRYSAFTLNETFFASEGFAALHQVTGNDDLKSACDRLMDSLLDVLSLGDGLFARFYIRDEERNDGFEHDTKGQGWSMEGLLAAHEINPEDSRYLKLAERLARIIIGAQHQDGHWTNFFDCEGNTGGTGEKSTSLWSTLLYRLYRFTNDEQHLQAAKNALNWCMDNQYSGDDQHARGSIVATSAQSGIGYRKYFNVSCTYASAFFGLAAIDEYKLRRMA